MLTSRFSRLVPLIVATAALAAAAKTANADSVSETNGLKVSPPLVYVKQTFLITEDERVIAESINAASTSISQFVHGINGLALPSSTTMLSHVLPGEEDALRLPPLLNDGTKRRFINQFLYCWKQSDSEHLEFRIDWAHVTRNDRYTDSYVFVRRDSEWYFEKHGATAPSSWQQTGRLPKRAC